METVADAFLSWVRDAFVTTDPSEPEGVTWKNFFNNNVGIFLRNSMIHNSQGGMLQYYIDRGDVPSAPIASFAKNDTLNTRMTPSTIDNNILYQSSSSNLSNPIAIYGVINIPPGDNSDYWVMSVDTNNRLVWIGSTAVLPINDTTRLQLSTLLVNNGEFNSMLTNPSRLVDSRDLDFIREG